MPFLKKHKAAYRIIPDTQFHVDFNHSNRSSVNFFCFKLINKTDWLELIYND